MADGFTKARLQVVEAILVDRAIGPLAARLGAHLALRYTNRAAFTQRGVLEAWPAQERVAQEIGTTVESVRRASRELAAHMTVKPGRGRGINTRYTFTLPPALKPGATEGVSRTRKPTRPPPFPRKKPHAEPVENPTTEAQKPPPEPATTSLKYHSEVKPSESRALALTSEPTISGAFEAWWSVYPLKTAKKAAAKCFEGILKRGEATADTLYAGAQRYALSDRVRRGFVKNPTTWLNGGCWTDEPDPHRNRPSAGWSAIDQSIDFLTLEREDPQ